MWIVYSVSSYSYSAAVWFVGFFWADVAAYSCVCDVFSAICWYLVLFDEKESVSSLHSSCDSLCHSSNFIAKGPTFLNGASAGVFAVVVAAATIKPNYQVHLLLFGQVRIKYISAFYVLWSFIETTGANAGGNIAHLGGAILGFIFAKNFLAASRPQAIFEIKIKEFAQAVHQKVQPRKELETVPEEELNAILDKISQSGYDSLTDFEQKRLFKASQKND